MFCFSIVINTEIILIDLSHEKHSLKNIHPSLVEAKPKKGKGKVTQQTKVDL